MVERTESSGRQAFDSRQVLKADMHWMDKTFDSGDCDITDNFFTNHEPYSFWII